MPRSFQVRIRRPVTLPNRKVQLMRLSQYFRAAIVEKFTEFLAFKDVYRNAGPKDDVPDFLERLPPELALEL